MPQYHLYLDESKQSGSKLPHFCLGGCIIAQDDTYKCLSDNINKLKLDLFSKISVPLHEYDIRDADEPEYLIFRKKEKRNQFWGGFREILTNTDFKVLCSAINCIEYCNTYKFCKANDPYQVTLQMIMENFAYYLVQFDTTGMIYVEKTDDHEARRLEEHFNRIRKTGTLYLSSAELKKRLLGINFLTKDDNCAGLQIADFVPNLYNRDFSGLPIKKPSIKDIMDSKLYDGGIGKIERFGKRALLSNNS